MLREWQRPSPRPIPVSSITTSSNDPPSNSLSPTPIPTSRSRLKRYRHRADVDGEGSGNLGKKKRRLRLELITSRLSKPFATPPTHIISKNASLRVGIWARQKVLGKNLLRKAALLNLIRMKRKLAAREAEQRQLEFARMVSMYDNVYVTEADAKVIATDQHQDHPAPTSHEQTSPLTPTFMLGQFADYDVIEYEQEASDSDEDGEEETETDEPVYSADDDDGSSDDEIIWDPFGGREDVEPLQLLGDFSNSSEDEPIKKSVEK